MASAALDGFVREALNKGETRARITAALGSAGWTAKEIEDCLSGYAETDLNMAVPKPRPYVSAREAFLYFVLFLLLGVVTWNLGSLLFALIDLSIKDVAEESNSYLGKSRVSQIRQGIAGLVVGAPIFAWLALYIRKQRRSNPAMQRSRVRKWLTYLTLVIAAGTLVGDAISLVYSFLSGDLSTRLVLKLAVVAMLASAVFFYFIRDAERGDEHDQSN